MSEQSNVVVRRQIRPVRQQIRVESYLPQDVRLLEERNEVTRTGAQDAPRIALPAAAAEVLGDDPNVDWEGMTTQLSRVSCAFLAQEILTGPPEPPYEGRFFIGDHHLEWDRLVTKYKRLCILSPRDSGKCMRAGHTILTTRGDRVRIEDWRGGELLAWDVYSKRYVRAYAPAVRENGVKPIYEITTASGRVLGLTDEHPLMQYGGWVQAKDTRVGDRIAVLNGLRGLGCGKVDSPWLLGLLVGDGCVRARSTTMVSTIHAQIKLHIAAEATLRGWKLGWDDERQQYRIYAKQSEGESCNRWLQRLGLWGKKSADKFVPEEVFKARDQDIREFLAGYFDADGSIESQAVRASSTSRQLLKDVQSLLARLGIISSINKRKKCQYKNEDYDFWELSINGGSTPQFYVQIRLRGEKRDQLAELVQRREEQDYSSGKSLDRFDSIVWDDLVKSETWHREQGGSRPTKQSQPTRQKVERVARQEDNWGLINRLREPVFWDEVVSIEIKDPEMTYALQVNELHTYISEDVINHNTFFFDFAYPIWQAVNNPGRVGFIFSATQPMAERILGDIKAEFEGNPKLNWLVPEKKELWRASSIQLANGHKIYARGFGTKVRGAHPYWIVVDDGLTDETAYSELVRTKQIEYFYTAITNMIIPGGQIVVVGTPFAKEDLYGNLQKNTEYKFKKFRAISEEGKALWPERYSLEDLEKRKREIGSVRFSREFLCCRENTYVETIQGSKTIQDICEGEIVLTHKGNWKKVTKTFKRKYTGSLVQIEGLRVTPQHPVFTQQGWVAAKELIPADFVLKMEVDQTPYARQRGYRWIPATTLRRKSYDGYVYNIEVEEDNSYIADGVAVHNCNPIDDSSSFFPKRLFTGEPVEQYGVKLGMPRQYWEDKGVQIFMGVDFAMSTSVQADYTVVWVMGRDNQGNRWIIDIHRAKGLPFQEQLSLINKVGRKYDPNLIFLEANQMQRIFGDELIRTSDLPIKQFTTGKQKHNLEVGLPSMRVLLENAKFRIPRGDEQSVLMTDTWIDEMSSFTYEKGEIASVGAHDDTAMASWICNEAIRQGGFQFSFGDEYESDAVAEEDLYAELTGQAEQPTNGGANGNGKGNGKGAQKGAGDDSEGKTVANLVDEQHTLLNIPQWY